MPISKAPKARPSSECDNRIRKAMPAMGAAMPTTRSGISLPRIDQNANSAIRAMISSGT
jgi:hypothetical protein